MNQRLARRLHKIGRAMSTGGLSLVFPENESPVDQYEGGSVEVDPGVWRVGGKNGYIVHDPDGPQG